MAGLEAQIKRHAGFIATAGIAVGIGIMLYFGFDSGRPLKNSPDEPQENEPIEATLGSDADQNHEAVAPSAAIITAPVEAPIDPERFTTPKGERIGDAMPYVGMPEGYLDHTWLGPHAGEGESPEGSLWAGSIPYYWTAHDGTKILTAFIRDGEIIKLNKSNEYTDYWRDAGGAALVRPNLDGTGARVEPSRIAPLLESPNDYSTPEEYADNAEGYFAYHGSSDPWMDAYEYWCANA